MGKQLVNAFDEPVLPGGANVIFGPSNNPIPQLDNPIVNTQNSGQQSAPQTVNTGSLSGNQNLPAGSGASGGSPQNTDSAKTCDWGKIKKIGLGIAAVIVVAAIFSN